MNIETFNIKGLFAFSPRKFEDERGYFFESFNLKEFRETSAFINVEFVQDNQSKSKKNVLRGLHYQEGEHAQGKLVRVSRGRVLDVAVDLRKESRTYGEHVSIELSEENGKVFWVPAGFAHGFISLEDDTVFNYKCTKYYNKESERCIIWNDESLNIDWRVDNPIVSEKDAIGLPFEVLVNE